MTRRGHHEGTKHHRADGRWEWRITLAGGKRRSFYGRTEREARDKKNAAIRDHESGLAATDARLTVKVYLQRWLIDTAAHRVRDATLRSYESLVRVHIVPALGRVRLRELTATDVNRMLAGMMTGDGGVSAATANRARACLRTALASAVKAGLVPRNAAQLADARTERRARIVPYTPEQARHLIRETRDDWMGPLLTLALATGMRQGELLALRWSDVDIGARLVRVERTLGWRRGKDGRREVVFGDPKTEQSRRGVPLTGVAAAALERQRVMVDTFGVSSELVFPSMRGTPQDGVNVTQRAKRLMAAAGLPEKRFHDLRHSAASFLLAEGAELFVVKEVLGHSQISLTANTYGHMTPRLAMDAAARMGRALDDDPDDDPDDRRGRVERDGDV